MIVRTLKQSVISKLLQTGSIRMDYPDLCCPTAVREKSDEGTVRRPNRRNAGCQGCEITCFNINEIDHTIHILTGC